MGCNGEHHQLIDGPISKDAKVREPSSQRLGMRHGVWSLESGVWRGSGAAAVGHVGQHH
ncbi:GM24143 [Drosophila sechellia]|uniref:GM24143 n=1 Tax=Drosophila sechellia TaxID=7238 RepID=B4HF73_DROSE|nr:GM24143 [Drosophila sechellia]